jgi:hypothetical protein
MRIYILDFTHDRYYPVLTGENVLVRKLLTQVTPQLVEKRGPGRQIVAYLQKTGEHLVYDGKGHFTKVGTRQAPATLHPWQTLGSAGITENEVLIMCYFIQPGAENINLNERLEQEHRWLMELAKKTDLIDIEAIEGSPPRRYRITYRCKGVALHPQTRKPILTANHVLNIYLPAGLPGYPNEAPYVTCSTPHFHPNISDENNMVCIGIERDWDSSLNIAWLVLHLADMISYRIYGLEKPYNKEAVKWTEENKEKLPVDNRPVLKEELAVTKATQSGEEGEVAFESSFELPKVGSVRESDKSEQGMTAQEGRPAEGKVKKPGKK